jgi:hypothetical protein
MLLHGRTTTALPLVKASVAVIHDLQKGWPRTTHIRTQEEQASERETAPGSLTAVTAPSPSTLGTRTPMMRSIGHQGNSIAKFSGDQCVLLVNNMTERLQSAKHRGCIRMPAQKAPRLRSKIG